MDFRNETCVLKKAKGNEAVIYRSFLSQCDYAPKLCACAQIDGAEYLLMEYIPGHDLKKANREDLVLALEALIAMQSKHWMHADPTNSYEKGLDSRNNRRGFLLEPHLEQAYDAYLAEFATMPRTLCHDDLLPFNVIISRNRAVLIDWEVAGILPYSTSLARLIAHGEEDETAFFYLNQEDRAFAIDYYYDNLVQKKGISRQTFDRSLALCLFYEYCEWVYVGNKYDDRENKRFRAYWRKAIQQAKTLGF